MSTTGTILSCIIILMIIRLLGEIYSKKQAPEIIEPAPPEKTGTERYHEYAHRMIIRHGLRTIDHILKKCTYGKQEREGMMIELWVNCNGDHVKMLRADGVGYIQLFNERGEAFGTIWINPDEEPTASVICNSNQFQTNMQWFLAHY